MKHEKASIAKTSLMLMILAFAIAAFLQQVAWQTVQSYRAGRI
jgi:hypothetical protein